MHLVVFLSGLEMACSRISELMNAELQCNAVQHSLQLKNPNTEIQLLLAAPGPAGRRCAHAVRLELLPRA